MRRTKKKASASIMSTSVRVKGKANVAIAEVDHRRIEKVNDLPLGDQLRNSASRNHQHQGRNDRLDSESCNQYTVPSSGEN